MPKTLMDKAAGVQAETENQQEKMRQLNEALDNPEVAIVITPDKISDVSRDLSNDEDTVNKNPVGNEFAICTVKLTKDDEYFPFPKDEDIQVCTDKNALMELVQNKKVYVFDEEDIASIQTVLADTKLPPELFVTVKKTALEIDEESEGDIFTTGYYGAASLDPPLEAADVTPKFALRWLCEIVTVVHGFEYEKRRVQSGKI